MLQGWFMILIGLGFLATDNKNLDIFFLVPPNEEYRNKSFSDATPTVGPTPTSG